MQAMLALEPAICKMYVLRALTSTVQAVGLRRQPTNPIQSCSFGAQITRYSQSSSFVAQQLSAILWISSSSPLIGNILELARRQLRFIALLAHTVLLGFEDTPYSSGRWHTLPRSGAKATSNTFVMHHI